MPKESAKVSRIFTVTEITQDIKLVLEGAFNEVWVEGEVSGISKLATGTVFFNLKDNSSLLRCVMFSSYVNALKFEIKDGIKLVCSGRISVYEKDGKYQFYVEKIEPKGLGLLQLALEQLKQKLEKEGLFSPGHKRQIPYLPSRIGLVTSLQGAAIKDMFKVLERRFKDVHIIIAPVRVQGEGAKDEIAQAIQDFNLFNEKVPLGKKVEVLIVGRGGGSIEDLWAFNEEAVARAIYDSAIPVISAVGHERDWTIADLVADVRAATPSVAAEMVLPKKEDLNAQIKDLREAMRNAFVNIAASLRDELDHLAHRLKINMDHTLVLSANEFNTAFKKLNLLNPALIIRQYREKAVGLSRQIQVCMAHFFKIKSIEFSKAAEKLSGLSPLNVLSRGYSITFKMDGGIVKDVAGIKAGDFIKSKVRKGELVSQVKEIH